MLQFFAAHNNKIAIAHGKELKQFCPPRRSDDFCLLFCLYSSSLHFLKHILLTQKICCIFSLKINKNQILNTVFKKQNVGFDFCHVGNLSRYKQSFRSFGHVRAAPPAPPPPPPAAPSEPGSLALEDLPAPEEEEDDDDIQSSSTLPSPIREEPPGLVRQIHTGPVTRKESLLNGPKINFLFF